MATFDVTYETGQVEAVAYKGGNLRYFLIFIISGLILRQDSDTATEGSPAALHTCPTIRSGAMPRIQG